MRHVPEYFRKQNWKTEKLFFPERWFSIKKHSFSVLLTELFRNIRRQNWKTEKLKNCFFQRDPGRDSPGKNSFSVFQFCLRNSSGTFPETNPEHFRRQHWKTEKLKNCFFMENLSLDLSGKNSFSVFQFCLNYSGDFPETKLKNWKTVFSREIQGAILHKKTVFQFFSFVYGNVPE